ncbi:hypothetical protein FZEAL_3094 [Fusarium zealandicum]|uniref:DUF676 domain-containing protein n=1 Tax=Fusarium zealandicum TaxID=1053134 RepID=A0A8H4XM57_9HYPO|nr:hypothetical protein FZEAL_3094 [Fusarium zealandicum]
MSLRRATTKRSAGGAALPRQAKALQGIRILYPQEEPGKPERKTDMDIVFVPGLGAHPEDSWMSTKTGFNWASDGEGIARDFPNARVLLYMYESAWMGRFKVKQFINNLASTLLEGLHDMRKTTGLARPIVFVGHSMGGLVIAKAVCIAESRQGQSKFLHLFEDIAGCAVFGTPFGGADAAGLAVMLSQVGQMFDQTITSNLLDLMKPGNEGLKELVNEFQLAAKDLDPKISLCGFYEEQKTEISDLSGVPQFIKNLGIPLPKKIAEFVTKDSAILGGAMESVMGLASNHRDLVKFESSKDERYALVRGPLKRIIHGAHLAVKGRRNSTRHIDKDLVNRVLVAFVGAQMWRKRKTIAHATALSSWFPKEAGYLAWLARPGDSQESFPLKRTDSLWIRGPNGRGKTSAALAALKEIDQMIEEDSNTTPTLLAYFFCDDSPDYNTAEDLLKSLVRQLIKQHERLATHAQFLVRKKGKGDSEDPKSKEDSKGQPLLTVENLWQVLQDILADEDLFGTRVYLVVNNLEELPHSTSTSTLLDLLSSEIKSMDGSRNALVRWLITSGQTWSIDQALKGESVRLIDLQDAKYADRVQLELRKHAQQKVSILVTQKNYSKALAYFASSLIGRRAQNTQWIDITCAQLEVLPQHKSDLQVRLHLEVVPQQLGELLTSAWRHVFAVNPGKVAQIKEVLRVLVLTFEDPTETELGLLSGLDSTDEQRAELHDLVETCTPLLSFERTDTSESKVCFKESVVKTHLVENAYKLLGLTEEDIELQHGMLGLRAFSHVMEAFNWPAAMDDEDGDEDTEEENEENEDDDASDHSAVSEGSKHDGDASSSASSVNADYNKDTADVVTSLMNSVSTYAVKHWLPHASKATEEIAEALSEDENFWGKDSIIRRRWLTRHTQLTDSFRLYDRSGLSGLHVAAAIGFRQLVVALMKNGHDGEMNMRDSNSYTPLHLAVAFGQSDIIEELLDNNAAINDGQEDHLETPLHKAAAEGNVQIMERLLQRKANPNADCDTYGGVINAAIKSGNCETVRLLVKHEVSLIVVESDDETDEDENDASGDGDEGSKAGKENDEEEEDDDENEDEYEEEEDEDEEEVIRSPLALAATRSDLTMFEFLIEHYSEKLTPQEFSKALVKAAEYGRLEAFTRLFKSYEHTKETKQEALDEAAWGDHWDVVRLLLEECVDLNCDEAFLRTAQGPDGEPEIQILEALWEYSQGLISTETLDESLYEATDYENIRTIERLLRFGANPDATGKEYGNALTAAAYDGRKDIVQMLLDANANVNSPDGWALQTAAEQGHMEIVDLLLKSGADVNACTTHEDMTQGTALQAAIEAGKNEIVDVLLEHGADPDLGGGDLTCPIIAAASKSEGDIVRRLVEAKADVNVVGGPYNSTPITYAATSLPQSSIRLILDAGADINFADEDGDTALILAASSGGDDYESVQFLLESGADVLIRNKANQNALEVAVKMEESECVKVLVSHVSVIMEALRVAMASGDAAVTAVVRGLESRKNDLESDKQDDSVDGDVQDQSKSFPSEYETEKMVVEVSQQSSDQTEFEPQGVPNDVPQDVQRPSSMPWNEGDRNAGTVARLSWAPVEPYTVARNASFCLAKEEQQRLKNQHYQPWDQESPPALPIEHQPPSRGPTPIRRKPISGNVPYRPPPVHHSSDPIEHVGAPGTTQWDQYRAYRPPRPSFGRDAGAS